MYNPLKVGHLSGKFTTTHPAIDMSWVGDNAVDPAIHAWRDGVVVQSAFEYLGGNVMAILHEVPGADYDYLTRYAHLKSRGKVIKDKVLGDTAIGIGGHTGTRSEGRPMPNHLHFEIWKIPKGYVFTTINGHGADRAKYAIDPQLLMSTNMRGEGFRMVPITLSNTATAKILAAKLQCRDLPGLSSIKFPGYLAQGASYPFYGSVVVDGYKWAELRVNNRIVYAAMAVKATGAAWIEVTDPTKEIIKTVEIIKEVERPIDVFGNIGDLHIVIQRPVK